MPTKGVAFLHENAHLQIALHTIDTFEQLHFEVLEHPPFCSHLTPVDYHVFGPLKTLCKDSFSTSVSTSERRSACIACQPAKTIFSWGIQKLITQWKKCIENKGGCLENNAIVQT